MRSSIFRQARMSVLACSGHDGAFHDQCGRALCAIQSSIRTLQFRRGPISAMSHLTALVGYSYTVPTFYQYPLIGEAERSFNGVGPSLSWTASAPCWQCRSMANCRSIGASMARFCWQTKERRCSHQTTEAYYLSASLHSNAHRVCNRYRPTYVPISSTSDRSQRRVTVPNLGGFAGLSARYADAKISLGYRDDIFLSAMDTGIDARKTCEPQLQRPLRHHQHRTGRLDIAGAASSYRAWSQRSPAHP